MFQYRILKIKTEAVKTLPLGIIIVRNDYIITVCLQKYQLLDEFTQGKVKEFYTYKKESLCNSNDLSRCYFLFKDIKGY